MTAKSTQRRGKLAEALRTVAPGEFITLDEMMVIWGVSKGTMVNTRNVIPDFPEPHHVGTDKRVFYPAREALEAMQRWEHRGDAVTADRSRRLNAIMGVDEEATPDAIPISEMAKASALRAEVEQRMIAQRALIHRQDTAATAARVFELISRLLSNLGTVCDPNGRWPAAVRENADKAGRERLLRIHAEMKDMLAGNEHADRPRGDRSAGNRARPAGTPRVSGPGGGRVAQSSRHDPAGKGGVDKQLGGRRAKVREGQ